MCGYVGPALEVDRGAGRAWSPIPRSRGRGPAGARADRPRGERARRGDEMTRSSKRGATGPGAADACEARRPAGDAVAGDRQPETRDGERRGEDSPTAAATDTTRVARATLRASALGLQAIHDELERVARGLPAAAELEPDEASADVATELRSVIESSSSTTSGRRSRTSATPRATAWARRAADEARRPDRRLPLGRGPRGARPPRGPGGHPRMAHPPGEPRRPSDRRAQLPGGRPRPPRPPAGRPPVARGQRSLGPRRASSASSSPATGTASPPSRRPTT